MYATRILLASLVLCMGHSMRAQNMKLTIPGSAFRVHTPGNDIVAETVQQQLTVRAPYGKRIKLIADVERPDPAMATDYLQGIAVHFVSDKNTGASLRRVTYSTGATAPIDKETSAMGDFSTRERTNSTNNTAWYWNESTVRIYDKSYIMLEVWYPHSFAGQPAPTYFTVVGVDIYVPRKNKFQAGGAHQQHVGSNVLVTPADPHKESVVPPVAPADETLYGHTAGHELKWYRLDKNTDGSLAWAGASGTAVRAGWSGKQTMYGGGGVIYTITDAGDLLWHRHNGYANGKNEWAAQSGSKVGEGWNFKQVFSGGAGVLYAIDNAGDLWWYHHTGFADGSNRWATQGMKVGNGWNFRTVFSGGNGVIYAISDAGDLFWYQHTGAADGSNAWHEKSGGKVGEGWNFKQVVAGSNGIVYAVDHRGDLWRYEHAGYTTGAYEWVGAGSKIGNGWDFKEVF